MMDESREMGGTKTNRATYREFKNPFGAITDISW
jgi:hypothetical protein